MKIVSKSLKETKGAAQLILANLLKAKSQKLKAVVLLLEGDLGSGKTTFVQFLAQELGVKSNLTSPTFVLMKKYEILRKGNFKHLIHIDAYRLNSGQDLLALGWAELTANPTNLIVIEWPERVADLWTGREHKINFKFIDDQTREISD
ncbi:MAG: tRNA (adenosine(37)-N6)-threonylcarbamoyltransferase complex ATPase subunit type 1 TsaE [Candidatus Paceibacterota bacterium]|jgi:tRNA threonylcarbamoyladenosine biosynthesis protein TsaE